MIELTLYDKAGDNRRRILLDPSQVESVKEEADDVSFGLHGTTTAGPTTFLEIRMRSGAVHHVAGPLEPLRAQLAKRED
jgi:hypothetical protein